MASHPIPSGDAWRIRWTMQMHQRSESMPKDASCAAPRPAHAEAARRYGGLRAAPLHSRSFAELCDYWLTNGLCETEQEGRRTIIRRLRASFGRATRRAVGVEQADQ